jgi:hypothetical protein
MEDKMKELKQKFIEEFIKNCDDDKLNELFIKCVELENGIGLGENDEIDRIEYISIPQIIPTPINPYPIYPTWTTSNNKTVLLDTKIIC